MNIDERKLNLHLLIDKYKLLWNHYKLQLDSAEKRRHFFWLVQSALFLAWYTLFSNCYLFIPIFITIIGIIISFFLVFVIKRDRESIFLTEKELRDTECQLNEFSEIEFSKFNFDKKSIWEREKIIFEYSGEKIDDQEIDDFWGFETKFFRNIHMLLEKIPVKKFPQLKKLRSVRFLFDYFIPLIFIFIWIVILDYTIIKWSIILGMAISFLLIIGLLYLYNKINKMQIYKLLLYLIITT